MGHSSGATIRSPLGLGACTTDSGDDSYLADAPTLVDDSGAEGKADGTWQAVERLDGLPGTYVRGVPGVHPLLSLRLDGDENDGTYSAWWRRLGVPTFESGTYHAVPENPAVGFAFIQLETSASVPDDLHVLVLRRIRRDGETAPIARLDIKSSTSPTLKAVLYRVDD